MPTLNPKRIRLIFVLAGLYNLGWMLAFWLLPLSALQDLGMLLIPSETWPLILSGAVGILGLLYLKAAWQPATSFWIAFLGILTKSVGVIIALTGVQTGNLPEGALLSALFNDLIWIPAFFLILRTLFLQMKSRPGISLVASDH